VRDLVREDHFDHIADPRFLREGAFFLEQCDRHRLREAADEHHVAHHAFERIDAAVLRQRGECRLRLRDRLATERLHDVAAERRVHDLVGRCREHRGLHVIGADASMSCGRSPAKTADDRCSFTMRARQVATAASRTDGS
jgi:hypothetical protein